MHHKGFSFNLHISAWHNAHNVLYWLYWSMYFVNGVPCLDEVIIGTEETYLVAEIFLRSTKWLCVTRLDSLATMMIPALTGGNGSLKQERENAKAPGRQTFHLLHYSTNTCCFRAWQCKPLKEECFA